MNVDVVILAAGKGTRMRSALPKVLHPVGGRALLSRVVDTALELDPRNIAVVVGHGAEQVEASCRADQDNAPLKFVLQEQQLGTGHAVSQATAVLPNDGCVLVLYGDVPLVKAQTLQAAVAAAQAGHVGLVTAEFDDPAELGRIVRNENGGITEIVEFKDADNSQRAIHEINSGIMAVPGAQLNQWLAQLDTNNAQGELYLTDIIAMAVADGVSVAGIPATQQEVIGINDRAQLAEVERLYQHDQIIALMQGGATVADPARVDIRGRVTTGQDCFIDINVVFEGDVTLGNNVIVGPGSVIIDSALGDGTEVKAHTVVEGASVSGDCALGPFARIRPGTVLDEGVKIGNFVETKKTHLGPGSKASHLAYLGDAKFGKDCNIGAGAITANYDGVNKFETNAGDHVFVGTNVTMVAPLELEDLAFLAAGSTVTGNVDQNDLAVARGKQRNIRNWERPDQKAGKAPPVDKAAKADRD